MELSILTARIVIKLSKDLPMTGTVVAAGGTVVTPLEVVVGTAIDAGGPVVTPLAVVVGTEEGVGAGVVAKTECIEQFPS